jgi:hypothetical protein
MLTRDQQILIKRAQAQAKIGDAEYRDAVALVSGIADCRSSKDARLTDGHLDKLMAYFEAIYWRKVAVESGAVSRCLQGHLKPGAVFQKPGYWASKNQTGNTSRDRYVDGTKRSEAADLEAELGKLGYGSTYVAAIQRNIRPFSQVAYVAALKRTLNAKQKATNCPF